MAISKIKIGDTEHELQTTIANVDGLQDALDDKADTADIPTVNNGTLTIQKNGTTVKTFTANSSSNVTANITVPTKTSELTNDSGFKTTDNNTTYSISKSGSTITLTGSDGSTSTVTDDNDNTEYNVATISTSGLMSAADKTKVGVTNIAYGTCTTAAATAAKVITISGNDNWELTAGSLIVVKFSYTNTASNPTFNVNGTGAKSVIYGTSTLTTSSLSYAGYGSRYIEYMYNGSAFVFIGWSYDANTTYANYSLGQGYGTCTTAEATTAKVVTLSNYALSTGGIIAVKFTYAVPAGSTMNINSKGAKSIYHRGAAITDGVIQAGDTATFIYSSQYHLISIDRDEAGSMIDTQDDYAWDGDHTFNGENTVEGSMTFNGSVDFTNATVTGLPESGSSVDTSNLVDLTSEQTVRGQKLFDATYSENYEAIKVIYGSESAPYVGITWSGFTHNYPGSSSWLSTFSFPHDMDAGSYTLATREWVESQGYGSGGYVYKIITLTDMTASGGSVAGTIYINAYIPKNNTPTDFASVRTLIANLCGGTTAASKNYAPAYNCSGTASSAGSTSVCRIYQVAATTSGILLLGISSSTLNGGLNYVLKATITGCTVTVTTPFES